MRAPLAHANRMFAQAFEHLAREELALLPPESDLLMSVQHEILRSLACGRACLDDCARSLHLSARTLTRHLAEGGTTYQQLLDETRRSRALQLLRTGFAVDEAALLLGYAERASFHRACVRWFGKTPAQLKRELQQNG